MCVFVYDMKFQLVYSSLSLSLSLSPSPYTEIPDVGGDTSKALSQILDTAYNLEFNERTSTSAVRLLVERIKQAFGVRMLKNPHYVYDVIQAK